MFCTTPISLFTAITLTSRVGALSASRPEGCELLLSAFDLLERRQPVFKRHDPAEKIEA